MTKLEPGILIGTSYLDRFVKSVEPIARRIKPIHSDTVPILKTPEYPKAVFYINQPKILGQHADVFLGDEYDTENKITLVRVVTVPALNQICVPVVTKAPGLITITVTTHWRTQLNRMVTAAKGVAKVWTYRPFHILLANMDNEVAFLQNT